MLPTFPSVLQILNDSKVYSGMLHPFLETHVIPEFQVKLIQYITHCVLVCVFAFYDYNLASAVSQLN